MGYFCGWYYRCQSEAQTLAVIASFHKTGDGESCAIQLITDEVSFHVPFPISDFRKDGNGISIGGNRFGQEGIRLDIRTPQLEAVGFLHFGAFSPIRYDIMGPFRYVPALQCRHSVYSMHHRVDGEIRVNGVSHIFRNTRGYMEGDRGRSFPKEYFWTQCCFPEGSLMLSVADIPIGAFHFTGVIGIVLLGEKEYRFATYLGGKAVRLEKGNVQIRQGKLSLSVRWEAPSGHPLQAPTDGAMARTIHEHPGCRVAYLFQKEGHTLLALEAPNAALEYEYGC